MVGHTVSVHVPLIIFLLLSYGNYEGQGKVSISSLEINRSLKHVGAYGHCFPRSKRNSKVAADTMQCNALYFPFFHTKENIFSMSNLVVLSFCFYLICRSWLESHFVWQLSSCSFPWYFTIAISILTRWF